MAGMVHPLLPAVILAALFSLVSGQTQVCVADIAMVVDHSGSIRDTNPPTVPADAEPGTHPDDNWTKLVNFMVTVVQRLDIGQDRTRLASISFANRARVDFDLDDVTDRTSVIERIRAIRYSGGNTNTTGGLRTARTEVFVPTGGDRANVRNIIILITDGIPTREVPETEPEATRIKNSGTRIVGVGVTNSVDEAQMRRLVSQPSDDFYISVSEFGRLEEILDQLIQSACRIITTPPPISTPPPASNCRSGGDIALVLDVSGSIDANNFDLVKTFLGDMISDLPIDEGAVRLALMTYSDNPDIQFHFNQIQTRAQAETRIRNMVYTGGRTNTAQALRFMHDTMFTSQNGDRSGSPNIAVVMTDGGSTNPKADTITQALQAKQKGIHIITIAIGGWVDQQELIGISSQPYENNKIDVASFGQLQNFRSQLRRLICNTQNECDSGPCRNGGQCVDGIGYYTCLCPDGFAGVNCERNRPRIACREQSDVVFTLDKSGSIGKLNFRRELDFVRGVVREMNLNRMHRVGLESYSNSETMHFNLNAFQSKAAVTEQLNIHYTGGTTNTAGALRMARDPMFTSGNGRRGGNVRAINFVITDGRSNDEAATWEEAMQSRRNGITIVPVGIGNNVRDIELEGMASDPVSNNMIRVSDFQTLPDITNRLMQAICNDVNECSSNPCQNGGQCIDGIGGYICDCPPNFSGLRCERRCSNVLDLGLVLDASGSIRRERWDNVIDYLVSIVRQLSIDPTRTRVGAVRWSDNANLEFSFNQYTTRQDVIAGLRHMRFLGGRTNTASALRLTTDTLFTSNNGDRQNAPDLVLVFTDGGSNIQADQTIPEAIRLKIAGKHVIVVSVGNFVNRLELRGIASEPTSQNIFEARSFRDLPNIVNSVVGRTCNDRNECDQNPCSNGQCIDGFGRFECNCNDGWVGERCDRRCTRQMDLVFILDLSGSVDTVYNISIAFTRAVVYGLPFTFQRARVGLVSFSDRATVNFRLDAYTTQAEVRYAIAFGGAGGQTNTQDALRAAREDVFGRNGDRSGVQNFVVVVTDGESNVQQFNTLPEAARLRQAGVEVYGVAVGSADMTEINGIATDPDNEHVITIPSQNDVQRAADQLISFLCQN